MLGMVVFGIVYPLDGTAPFRVGGPYPCRHSACHMCYIVFHLLHERGITGVYKNVREMMLPTEKLIVTINSYWWLRC